MCFQSSSPPSVSPNSFYTLPMPKKATVQESPKVVLKGKGLKEAEVDKPAVFHIDGRNAGPGLYLYFGIVVAFTLLNRMRLLQILAKYTKTGTYICIIRTGITSYDAIQIKQRLVIWTTKRR